MDSTIIVSPELSSVASPVQVPWLEDGGGKTVGLGIVASIPPSLAAKVDVLVDEMCYY
jgi:hypothetical protein